MASLKETPRQKMIGMMYLVLTALLALQVSDALLQIDNIDELPLTDIEYTYGDCQVFSLCIYPDLQHLTNHEAIVHYFVHGIEEQRKYLV